MSHVVSMGVKCMTHTHTLLLYCTESLSMLAFHGRAHKSTFHSRLVFHRARDACRDHVSKFLEISLWTKLLSTPQSCLANVTTPPSAELQVAGLVGSVVLPVLGAVPDGMMHPTYTELKLQSKLVHSSSEN